MRLGSSFIIMVVIKAAKNSRQPAERPDQAQVRPAVGDHQAETLLQGESQTPFRLSLHYVEGISYHQVICDQYVPPIGGVCQVSRLTGDVICAAHELTCFRCMSSPGH